MYLSKYKLMWMFVFFDLPVMTRQDRHNATKFRKLLLDEGFVMTQYSVYYRLLSGKEAGEAIIRRLQKELPKKGKVDIIQITDKQYEDIISFTGTKKLPQKKNPDQLSLF